MANRSSCVLHKPKLTNFIEWMESRGWKKESVKGHFEVLRMRRHDAKDPILVYDRAGAKEHYTTFGLSTQMVRKWLNNR